MFQRMAASVAVAAALALSGCNRFDDEAQMRVAAQELTRDMAAVSSASDPDHLPPIDPASQARGKAGAFSRTFKAFLIKIIADRRAFQKESEAAGVSAATKPEALAATGGLERARAAVAQNRAVVIKYRDLNAKRLQDVRADVRAVAPGSAVAKGFEKGLDSSLSQQGGAVAQLFATELKTLDEFDRMLDDLERSKGRWRAIGGQMMFQRGADLAAFDGHVRAIQMAAFEERMIVNQASATSAAGVSHMQDLSKR